MTTATNETNRVTITAKDLPAAILVEGGKLTEHELNRIAAFLREVEAGNKDLVLVLETPEGVKIAVQPVSIGPSDPPEVVSKDELVRTIRVHDDVADAPYLADKLLSAFSITKKS